MTTRVFRAFVVTSLCVCSGGIASAADAKDKKFSSEQIEFFEKHVRPVLIERCFECHSSDADEVEAGLLLDSRQALLKGGETGPAIVPGNPEKSLIIQSVRYLSLVLRAF